MMTRKTFKGENNTQFKKFTLNDSRKNDSY